MKLAQLIRRGAAFAGRIPWKAIGIAAAVLLSALIIAGVVAAHVVELPERLQAGDSVVVTYEGGRVAHGLLADDDRWRFPTRLEDVDPAYVEALLALEDRRFYHHPGVDPLAVVRAAIDNLRAGSVVSGASTITMQLVRLLEPRPRTFGSKVVEALRAIQLEMHMSKDEILEAYLRFAPYGRNIEGIEAATLSFWDRSPSGLTSAEIATLLAIPQNPQAYRPDEDNRRALREARNEIAEGLADQGAIPMADRPDRLEQMLEDTPVPIDAGGPPREIPHVVHWLKAHRPEAFERSETARGEPAVRIETTLQQRTQRRVSRLVAGHASRLRASGAPHTAVVVMESDTGRVRALVGNQTFDSDIPGSHLAAFASPRSTGSLLKPVAYAAGLDEGIVAPSHMLADTPIVRGDYRPQNFDRRYRGLIEAEEALALSLNIPFVRLLERLGVDEFIRAMSRFGLEGPVRRTGGGGLELVVGGMVASPLEVASLYAGFARQGRPVAPRMYNLDHRVHTPVADDGAGDGFIESLLGIDPTVPAGTSVGGEDDRQSRAVSAAAAWLTQRALTRRPTPWTDVGPRRARDEGAVWKTGTSYAYHDAWTAGFGQNFTVAVWAGDLAYERHPELVGADVAAPLFFEIIEAVDALYPLRAEKPGDELAEIEVCSRSGYRPGEHCEHTATTTAPATTAAPRRCDWHLEVDVDVDTGLRLSGGCRPEGVENIERRTVERLPDEAARFERSRGRRAGTIPRLHPDCRGEHDATLAITSPAAESTIVLEDNRPAEHQPVRLEAYSSVGSDVHWYVDGAYVDSAGADEPVYFTPEPGDWTIAAVDEQGNRTTRQLSVEGRAGEPAPDN